MPKSTPPTDVLTPHPVEPPARSVPAWPLIVLALPAAVSIWAGWVGLGGLTGFGVVQLLPGIWDGVRINTAITLPIGMEAYAAYAMRAWLTRGTPPRARQFAKTSAISALVLGTLGQIAYHLMTAAHVTAAPWVVTMLVSCLPVAVLGMGAALYHLLDDQPEAPARPTPTAAPSAVPAAAPFRTGGFAAYPTYPTVGTPRPEPVSPPRSPDRPAGRPTGEPAGRPTEQPAERPAEQPTDRPGPATRSVPPRQSSSRGSGRKRAAKPRTEVQLAAAVREMAARDGGRPPSQYRVRRVLGVGGPRAARLVADLATTTAAAPHPGNGAAVRKEDTH